MARRRRGLGRLAVALAGAGALVCGCGGSGHSAGASVAAPPSAPPACSTAVAAAPDLTGVPTRMIAVGGEPFGIATDAAGRWSFVAVDDGSGSRLEVFSDHGLAPRLVRTIELPGAAVRGDGLVDRGRYLLIADAGTGAIVIDVARARTRRGAAVLGKLSDGTPARPGAIEVTGSPDGRYAFLAAEGAGEVAVYDLERAVAEHFRTSAYVGSVPLGGSVVGMAISPDGRWMYATSENAAPALRLGSQGTLSVIDLAAAERGEGARAVVANVAAHCAPVRVALSANGATAWVTARESDQLLAFSTARLRSDPARALIAAVRVGEAPVGLALVDGGRRIVVADSNRWRVSGARAGLSVVDSAAALAHRPAVLGTVRSGLFPRELSLEPGGRTLLVANYGSGQLEAVGVAALP